MTLDLDELEKLLADSTPRPWYDSGKGDINMRDGRSSQYIIESIPSQHEPVKLVAQTRYGNDERREDAALIVAAVNALPDLLRIARAARFRHVALETNAARFAKPEEWVAIPRCDLEALRAALSGETAGETTTDG